MSTRRTTTSLLLGLLIAGQAQASLISRIYTFADGQVLTASELNAEFNNAVNGVNSIDNANILAGAAIDASKIGVTIDGAGISRDGSTGALSVVVDSATLEISGDTVRIKDLGVVTAKINDAAVTNAKLGSGAVGTANIVNNAIQTAQLNASAVTTAKIADDAVTTAKILDSNVTTAKILDGTIVNADISASAAIVDTKLAQLTTSGKVAGSAIVDGDITQSKLVIRTTNTTATAGNILRSATGNGSGTSLTVVASGTLATTGSRPVMVCISADSSDSYFTCDTPSPAYCAMSITRNGSAVAVARYSLDAAGQFTPPGFCFVDVPTAGTQTYGVAVSASGAVAGANNARVIAYEIN